MALFARNTAQGEGPAPPRWHAATSRSAAVGRSPNASFQSWHPLAFEVGTQHQFRDDAGLRPRATAAARSPDRCAQLTLVRRRASSPHAPAFATPAPDTLPASSPPGSDADHATPVASPASAPSFTRLLQHEGCLLLTGALQQIDHAAHFLSCQRLAPRQCQRRFLVARGNRVNCRATTDPPAPDANPPSPPRSTSPRPPAAGTPNSCAGPTSVPPPLASSGRHAPSLARSRLPPTRARTLAAIQPQDRRLGRRLVHFQHAHAQGHPG